MPAIEQSSRCTQQKDLTPVTPQRAAGISVQNMSKTAHGDPQFLDDYAFFEDALEEEQECDFDEDDLYPNGPSDINIGYLCGTRAGDFAAANNLAGYNSTPKIGTVSYTWHHHLELGRMQLVKTTVHQQCSHDGGVAVWKKATGTIDYSSSPPRLTP
ncbi:MAG TPA: HNH endonuclease [Kofleriaceae bacterium]